MPDIIQLPTVNCDTYERQIVLLQAEMEFWRERAIRLQTYFNRIISNARQGQNIVIIYGPTTIELEPISNIIEEYEKELAETTK